VEHVLARVLPMPDPANPEACLWHSAAAGMTFAFQIDILLLLRRIMVRDGDGGDDDDDDDDDDDG
jgi:hypothetical protein